MKQEVKKTAWRRNLPCLKNSHYVAKRRCLIYWFSNRSLSRRNFIKFRSFFSPLNRNSNCSIATIRRFIFNKEKNSDLYFYFVNMSFTRVLNFLFIPQRSPLPEEHHSHKSISDLHFIDIFMDPYANVTGKDKKMTETVKRFSYLTGRLLCFLSRQRTEKGSFQSDSMSLVKLVGLSEVRHNNFLRIERLESFLIAISFKAHLKLRLMWPSQVVVYCQLFLLPI